VATGQKVTVNIPVRPEGIYADFNTNKGKIIIRLEYKKTPMTVANFIGLAEGTITNSTYPPGKPFYSGSIWHRVVKGHVIQGGEPSTVKDPANTEVNSIGYEIPNEITELSHSRAGMTGMANSGPHTNTCEYYITLGDRSYLDGNYTLFGEVVDGMDVVNIIAKGDTTYSVTIIRVGKEAQEFIVNDETFKSLADNQWRKVKADKEKRKEAEERFISANCAGLTVLPDGLRYKILKQGKGNPPTDGSVLNLMYTGRLISGLSFVSSADDGKPIQGTQAEIFICSAGSDILLKGLREVLTDMKEGETRLLVIPPDLAYGVNSGYYGKEIKGERRFVISPGETLIMEVTLIKFTDKAR